MSVPGPTLRRRRQRGFTLLEMLITLAITTIGLTGLLSLHVVTTKSNELAARSGEGVAVAQQTLEQYRNRQVLMLLSDFGVSTLPLDVNLNTIVGRAGTTFGRRLIVEEMTSVSNSLIKLRVEVFWTDEGAPGGDLDHRVALEVIRTVEEGL
jgi:prepilin-type N-terminal cleavage/methylation domain-containing protein